MAERYRGHHTEPSSFKVVLDLSSQKESSGATELCKRLFKDGFVYKATTLNVSSIPSSAMNLLYDRDKIWRSHRGCPTCLVTRLEESSLVPAGFLTAQFLQKIYEAFVLMGELRRSFSSLLHWRRK